MFESLLREFINESKERLNNVEEILLKLTELEESKKREGIVVAKREMHTIKGNAGMMGLIEIQQLCHTIEDQIEAIDTLNPQIENILQNIDRCRILLSRQDREDKKETKSFDGVSLIYSESITQDSVRIQFSSLDELVDHISEIIILRNRLKDVSEKSQFAEVSKESWQELKDAEEDISKVLRLLYNKILNLRMVPLSNLFRQMNRIVHDESIKEQKRITFTSSGGDTPIDKALLEIASEALGHLIRNAVIHGIEPPVEREAKGKSPIGNIILSAQITSNEVIIDVEDDGKGIDRDALREYAEKNNITLLPNEDPISIIFLCGFSSKKELSISAGRGVGLSAVREAVRRMGGQIEVESFKDIGTRFRIKFLLNVSIIRALIIKTDNDLYAISLSNVVSTHRIEKYNLHIINNTLSYKWANDIIPVLDIGYMFGTSDEIRDNGCIIIIEAGSKKRGLLVDEIISIEEIVVKSLDPIFENPKGISGSTILGNGDAILILDPIGLSLMEPQLEKNLW